MDILGIYGGILGLSRVYLENIWIKFEGYLGDVDGMVC